MKMQNKQNGVKMVVNLGSNPTVKTVTGNRRMARFTVACLDRNGNDPHAKMKWLPVVSWGSVAEMAGRFLRKGKRVLITGHVVERVWMDKKGNARTKSEIVATNLVLLDSGRIGVMRRAS
ncbi:MAG TPA: single-stranded DNA-binding protein [Bacteroidia bacterium]|nr:single-stranded DNA-binding protein [Bacteroidia bacterium]